MSNSSKRLLICAPGVPHLSQGASTVLFYHYISLFKNAGFSILNLLLLQSDNYTEEGLEEYTISMEEPGAFQVISCRSELLISSNKWSFYVNTNGLQETLDKIEEFNPDIVVCFDFLCACVVDQITASVKVVWLGDLKFQTVWYHTLYSAKEQAKEAWRLPIAWTSVLRWKLLYRKVLRKSDAVIVSSKSSEVHLSRLGISATYLPYPWPNAERDTADRAVPPICDTVPTFFFFGSLVGLGSRSAFHFLIKRVYPRLIKLWGAGGFRIYISGIKQLPEWVTLEVDDKKEFEFLGFVDSLHDWMMRCQAVIVPIDVPVGNRSRIVTAMACNALVIAHKNAALGNPDLIHEETCYLANNAKEFVACMERAYHSEIERTRISKNARLCYENRFEPNVAYNLFFDHLQGVIDLKKITK